MERVEVDTNNAVQKQSMSAPTIVERLKSVYDARSIISDPELGKTIFLQPCMDPATGERCPMLGSSAVPCRKGNGLIDVGLSTVYCPDSKISGLLRVVKL